MNKKHLFKAAIYLITPEDSSNGNNLQQDESRLILSPSGTSWLGVIKTVIWAMLSLVLALISANTMI